MITVYQYAKCSTCRAAVKWLEENNIPHHLKPIRETPPTVAELRASLAAHGGDLRKLFNTSGMDYRAMGLKDKLPAMTENEALELLSTHGNLVKRPFATGKGISMHGFKPETWKKILL